MPNMPLVPISLLTLSYNHLHPMTIGAGAGDALALGSPWYRICYIERTGRSCKDSSLRFEMLVNELRVVPVVTDKGYDEGYLRW